MGHIPSDLVGFNVSIVCGIIQSKKWRGPIKDLVNVNLIGPCHFLPFKFEVSATGSK